MRLSRDEVSILKNTLYTLSKDAKIYLFGSRVDNNKRGGDIDLLVISNKLTQKDIRKLRVEFIKHFGEQKIDIVLDDGSFKEPFVKMILQKAVKL